jgi:hypothetical protein
MNFLVPYVYIAVLWMYGMCIHCWHVHDTPYILVIGDVVVDIQINDPDDGKVWCIFPLTHRIEAILVQTDSSCVVWISSLARSSAKLARFTLSCCDIILTCHISVSDSVTVR